MARAKAITKPVIDHWFNKCLKQSLEDGGGSRKYILGGPSI